MPEGSRKTTKKKSFFKQQKMMRKVLLALSPALVGGIYFFGWRVLALVVWVMVVGALVEYLMAKRRGDPLTESCLVTCLLFSLSLPPTIPFWMAAVGIVVALTFGKELFGGFGRNVFNPAIVGRGFLYVCFPPAMTGSFAPIHSGGLAGLAKWGPKTMSDGISALTAATPMWTRRDFDYATPLHNLFFGGIGGAPQGRILAAGSIGEVSALLLIIGGAYLLYTKTAAWRLVVGSLGGAVAATLIFRFLPGGGSVPPVPWTLCSGAMLYACLFMVTDPISAPKDKLTQLVYSAFIGVMIVFLRWRAVFAGGVAFAILLGNTVGPSVEIGLKALQARWKGAAQ
ncbi:MAG: RnfABCDGE type electron transport complex subunit D [Lentisphaeria bacterium]|nr:RnfABCDGE type electron transport complex subunit D [Lentisphaeria bacterium]